MKLTRAELHKQIWSEPLTSVAATYGLTGNGLAKICDRFNVPRPTRTHWTRVADRRDAPVPLPTDRRPANEMITLGRDQQPSRPRTRMNLAERQSQLMDMAADIVLNEGLGSLTLRELARRAGISDAQVHNCFAGRTALMVAMANREIASMESERQSSISRMCDRHTLIVLSTIGYLHEAAQRGPLLQLLLRSPDVKDALRERRQKVAAEAREPIIRNLTASGALDREAARAATSALGAITLRAGGVVAAGRADLGVVERLCLMMVMGGVRSNDEAARGP